MSSYIPTPLAPHSRTHTHTAGTPLTHTHQPTEQLEAHSILSDILSVLAMAVEDKEGHCLKYRLSGSNERISSFGHPYIRWVVIMRGAVQADKCLEVFLASQSAVQLQCS